MVQSTNPTTTILEKDGARLVEAKSVWYMRTVDNVMVGVGWLISVAKIVVTYVQLTQLCMVTLETGEGQRWNTK